MNFDIVEYTELSTKTKESIIEEHKERVMKKKEEIDDMAFLINKHLERINSELTSLK